MTIQLTSPWAPPPAVVVDFGWHNNSGALFPQYKAVVNNVNYPPNDFTWTVNGATYSTNYKSYTTPLNQPVVFDCLDALSLGLPTVVVPTGVSITAFEWDLGNGVTGRGPQVTTTYNFTQAPADQAVTLTVYDSLGRRFSTTHPIELVSLQLPEGSMNWARQGSSRT
jgi:hypothetical protein